MKSSDKNRAILAETVTKGWKDPDFRKQLLADPKSVLKDARMEIRDEMEVVALENTDKIIYAILPPVEHQELFDEVVAKTAANIGQLPDGVELRVNREKTNLTYFVVPAAPIAMAAGTMSDDDLEVLAGGKTATVTHQTAIQTTTVATTAEIATQAVEAQDVATTTTVVAEVEAVVVPCFIS